MIKDDKDKRIYVREKDHKRYKSWCASNGSSMLDGLGRLMDIAESKAGNHNQDNQG